MKKSGIFSGNLLICLVVLLVGGCAPGSEFQTVPQEGARRTGTYPRFSDQPKAETAQFTQDESGRLTNELEGEAKRLRSLARSTPAQSQGQPASSFADRKEEARRAAEETLKQIENGK